MSISKHILLVLVMLSSVIMVAMAITKTTDGILLKRVVVATIDRRGKLQLNFEWVSGKKGVSKVGGDVM